VIDLILINGCGGAGKETTGRELLSKLPRAALLDIKGLSCTNPWRFEDFELGITNAASLIYNYAEKGWTHIILVGGVNSSDRLSCLVSALRVEATIYYFWLDVPKTVRDARRTERRRDKADNREHLDDIDRVFTDPGELVIPGGRFVRIRPESLSPSQLAEMIKKDLLDHN
jgi:adenylate kinase family enzyme